MRAQKAAVKQQLAAFVGSLPYKPAWAAIVTLEGRLIEQYGVEVKTNKVVDFAAAVEGLSDQIVLTLGHGPFRYGIIGGSKGLFIIIALGDLYWLQLSYQRLNSLDRALRALREGVGPLLNVLYGD
ncbi:MAG: hypothetical protein HXY40_14845 [Chloroflexi bacterium]|nr:hypothetical protein [Chloroflexota bacterium]